MSRFILCVSLALLASCNAPVLLNDDDALLITILRQTERKSFGESIVLKKDNSNNYAISIVQEFKSILFENDPDKRERLYGQLGTNDSILKVNLFERKNELEHLISQQHEGFWGDETRQMVRSLETSSNDTNTLEIWIGKPIYSMDGTWAIVLISSNTHSSVGVFKKESGYWLEMGAIAPGIYSNRVRYSR